MPFLFDTPMFSFLCVLDLVLCCVLGGYLGLDRSRLSCFLAFTLRLKKLFIMNDLEMKIFDPTCRTTGVEVPFYLVG